MSISVNSSNEYMFQKIDKNLGIILMIRRVAMEAAQSVPLPGSSEGAVPTGGRKFAAKFELKCTFLFLWE